MSSPEPQTQKLALPALTMLVIGGMVGAGIFSLPRTFAGATGPFGEQFRCSQSLLFKCFACVTFLERVLCFVR